MFIDNFIFSISPEPIMAGRKKEERK